MNLQTIYMLNLEAKGMLKNWEFGLARVYKNRNGNFE